MESELTSSMVTPVDDCHMIPIESHDEEAVSLSKPYQNEFHSESSPPQERRVIRLAEPKRNPKRYHEEKNENVALQLLAENGHDDHNDDEDNDDDDDSNYNNIENAYDVERNPVEARANEKKKVKQWPKFAVSASKALRLKAFLGVFAFVLVSGVALAAVISFHEQNAESTSPPSLLSPLPTLSTRSSLPPPPPPAPGVSGLVAPPPQSPALPPYVLTEEVRIR